MMAFLDSRSVQISTLIVDRAGKWDALTRLTRLKLTGGGDDWTVPSGKLDKCLGEGSISSQGALVS